MSLTCIASKVLEHIVVKDIVTHLEKHGILVNNQHGFRSGRSCESQLFITSQDLAKCLDAKQQIDAAILDFSKAFDKVPHTRLLNKLHHYGIRGPQLHWIKAFLSNRTQRVVVDGEQSGPADVISGVPQGTVLGPTLFLLFINDITQNIDSDIRLFADDCLIYRPIDTPNDHILLQQDLTRLHEWSVQWQMEFNVNKCFIMQIHNNRTVKQHVYSMGDSSLSSVTSHPYLGIEISNKLHWAPHISNITSKASRLLGFLRRNLRKCPANVKEKAYFGMVRPGVEYCSTIWSPHQAGLKKKVEMVQHKAARVVCNQPYRRDQRDSVSEMLSNLGWESLESRRVKADLTLLWKVTHNVIAIPSLYLPPPAYSRTRANHSLKFQQPKANTNTYRFSTVLRTIPVWNTQPAELIEQPTLDGFRDVLTPMRF